MIINHWERIKEDFIYALSADENPTISIVLCKDKNNAIVEMTLLKDYIQEHKDQGETSINGGAGIENMPFEKWLEKI